jgi:hypothetical protein
VITTKNAKSGRQISRCTALDTLACPRLELMRVKTCCGAAFAASHQIGACLAHAQNPPGDARPDTLAALISRLT